MKIKFSAIFTLALTSSVSLFAAEKLTTDTINVISATPLPSLGISIDQLPTNIQVIKAKELLDSQTLDVSNYMNQNLSGVHINEMQGNPLMADVNYRGFTASPLLGTPQGLSVYLDGVRLNQPFGDVVSWDLIPKIAIAGMQLMPGSNPLFGLNTLGGALSLQSKSGRDFPGGSIQVTAGSYAKKISEFEYGGVTKDNSVDYYVAGSYFDENGWRDQSNSRLGQLFGKVGWRGDKTDLKLTYSYADSNLNGNGLTPTSFLNRDYSSVYTYPDKTKNKSNFVNLEWSHFFSDKVLFSGNTYFRKIKTNTYNGDINDDALPEDIWTIAQGYNGAAGLQGVDTRYTTGVLNSQNTTTYRDCADEASTGGEPGEKCNGMINRTRSTQDNYGIFGQASIQHAFLNIPSNAILGGGFDGSRTKFNQTAEYGYLLPDRGILGSGYFADGSGNLDGAPDDRRVQLRSKTQTFSLYATDTLSLRDNLHLTVAARYNNTGIKNTDQLVASGADSLSGNHHYNRLNPSLGLAFSPVKNLTTYGSYSESNRAPTAIELGCANPDNACRLPNSMAGDPHLDQVISKTYDIGARGGFSDFGWRLGYFNTRNVNDIQFISSTTPGRGYFDNFGQTKREGIEAAISQKIDNLSLAMNYTYLDATFDSEKEFTSEANSSNDDGTITVRKGNRIPLMPHHMAKFFANYRINDKFTIGANVLAVSSSYVRGNENNLHQADGETYFGSGKTAGYSVVNLTANYNHTKDFKVFGSILNIFDKEYLTGGMLGASGYNPADGSYALITRDNNGVGGGPRMYAASYGETFGAPGAPRTAWIGARYEFK